jgi:hypothetical protein
MLGTAIKYNPSNCATVGSLYRFFHGIFSFIRSANKHTHLIHETQAFIHTSGRLCSFAKMKVQNNILENISYHTITEYRKYQKMLHCNVQVLKISAEFWS